MARRIISKAVLSVAKVDLQEAAGSLQLCAGQIAGIEAAVHAMKEAFVGEDDDAVLLVDASNAFNSLNREAALHNIQHLCPILSTILTNFYRRRRSCSLTELSFIPRKALHRVTHSRCLCMHLQQSP